MTKFIVSAILGFSLVGCGGGGGGSSTEPKDDNSSSGGDNQEINVTVKEVDEYQRLVDLGLTPPFPDENSTLDDNISDVDVSKIIEFNDINDIITMPSRENNDTIKNSGFVVVNPDILDIKPNPDDVLEAISDFELMVITDEALVDSLESFKEHKDSRGVKTKIFSWQSLVDRFSGRDEPEKIKRAIAFYYKKFGVRYVMIVGDIDNFPSRFCKIYDNKIWGDAWIPSDLYYADLFNKSDKTFNDWDGNGNGIFCEMKGIERNPAGGLMNMDRIDGYIDVVVGRVPANTEEEVRNYVDKVIEYETSSPQDWQKRALMIVPGIPGGAPTDKDKEVPLIISRMKDSYNADRYNNYPPGDTISTRDKEKVAKMLAPFYSAIKLYHGRYYSPYMTEEKSYPIASHVVDFINKGVGIVDFGGHGAYNAWGMGQDLDEYFPLFSNNDILSLKNENKLPIVISVACDTGKYYFRGDYRAKSGQEFSKAKSCTKIGDKIYCAPSPKDRSGVIPPEPQAVQPPSHNINSMAEAFLVDRAKTGAIIFIGSTEATQGGLSDDSKRASGIFAVENEFIRGYMLRMIWCKIFNEPLRVGDAWRLGMHTYISAYVDMRRKESSDWRRGIPFKHLYKVHLFGDPTLELPNLIED
jgi:hypothetical protein